jgi:hypothetical protein
MNKFNALFKKAEQYIRIELIFITLGILLFGSYIIVIGAIYLKNTSEAIVINIGTEIMGIALTYFLIQLYIDTQRERNRKKIQEIAFTKLKEPLNNQFILFFEIYKSSLDPNTNFDTSFVKPKVSVQWFFSKDYKDQLRHFDSQKKYGSTQKKWQEYLTENTSISKEFGTVLDRYAVYFTKEQIDSLEIYYKSEFYQRLLIEPTKNIDFSEEDVRFEFQSYINNFIQITMEFNKINEIVISKFDDILWSNNRDPKFGSARI